MKKIIFTLCILIFFSGLKSFAGRLTSGPMLGYIEHKEALVWVETKNVSKVEIRYRKISPISTRTNSTLLENKSNEKKQQVLAPPSKGEWRVITKQLEKSQKIQPTKFILKNLEPGESYSYRIFIDNQEVQFDYPLILATKQASNKEVSSNNFSFLTGSCAFIQDTRFNSPWDHFPGGTKIYESMTEQKTDFMLWLGDNTYLRPSDYSSVIGILNRYSYRRALPNMQKFLASRSHYAIWDDHDYGPNNSNKTYELSEVTYNTFKKYWGNKTFGENGKGIYGKFLYEDAEFFLLDDRLFRDETEINEELIENKTQLGRQQIDWLKNSLKGSKATFKFIAVGGQFLNEYTNKESFNQYKSEREELIDFIVESNIQNVLFLTGDRHHTELIAREIPGYGVLYDLTSSALSSAPNKRILDSEEFNNPDRVEGTLLTENNFCKVEVTGKENSRQVELSCFDVNGNKKWSKDLDFAAVNEYSKL